ncbi:major facilitator superfamily domain-containing protein [Irpex rosettiformis]|uniref:Major facilitator superfamily domain-containing protein n=1 Tax=Irpex rosettiformis TaxID=378272 RepID=A0ACB8U0B7_9APHY|nr:major facilitator superfamily domain-containing protein [Irpex rosettiformis]
MDDTQEKAPSGGSSVLTTVSPKTEDPNTPPTVTYPEGGLRGWLTVIGGAMVCMCSFGVVQSFGVFQDYYTRITLNEHTASQISWIGSFKLCMVFFLGLPVGQLYDMGYFRVIICAGSLLYLFSVFMLSLTKPHHYYQTFLSQGVGMGLGMGMIFTPVLSIPSHYFRRRRALAMGCVVAGGVTWPIIFNHLLNDSAGFAWGVRTNGFIALLLLSLAILFMKTRLPARRDNPNAAKVTILPLFTDVPYLFAVAGGFFGFWGILFPFFYLQLYANLHGVPENVTRYLIPIMNAATLLGRIIPFMYAERFGCFNVIVPMTSIAGVLIFAMFGAGSTGGLLAFAIVYGTFAGGFLSLVAPMVAMFAKSVDEVGIRVGLACTVASFAMLTGNPISGAILHSPDYFWDKAIIFNAVLVLASGASMAISRGMLAKAKGTQWV